jgi:hypothetical protein
MKIEMAQQFFIKFPNIKFHETLCSCVMHAERHTDGLSKLNRLSPGL